MPLHVAFLWHMHQPYYVDPSQRAALMPWVRLHAAKGYLDMIWQVEQHPEFRCTFNLTPVLVQQIQELATGQVRDLWLELSATPAADLTPMQQSGILEHFFQANWENMIRRYPRYWRLLGKRGFQSRDATRPGVVREFTVQDYRDLQVWYNLAWCGYAADHLYPHLVELKRRGEGFTEDDKHAVLDTHHHILQRVLDHYRQAAARGQVELSTTPFFHPILPLVYDTEFARRCMEGRPFPRRFAHPEDVRDQLTLARQQHTAVFGSAPRGLWPSEGAVCPELVPLLQELGFEWFATDEGILWRTLNHAATDRNVLYQGHRVEYGGGTVAVAFRERSLSDFVGFTASRNEPERAADFLIGHLERIARHFGNTEPLCAIILDGENAWEHFPDGGRAFLTTLYRRIAAHPELRSTGLTEYFRTHPPQHTLRSLHTGSWINADFDIWIGDPEENRGWDLLGQTRDFLQAKIARQELTADQQQAALREIYAAEGSDWFWWYGGDFVTDNDILFDELFRAHLQNVYRICSAPIPDALRTQICRSEAPRPTSRFTDLITPTLDGRVTSFYEWMGAVHYEASKSLSAMYRAEWLVHAVHFGADLTHFYLRLDFARPKSLPVDLRIQLAITAPVPATVHIQWEATGEVHAESETAPGQRQPVGQGRLGEILELALPFAGLGWTPRRTVTFIIYLVDGGVELERHPDLGAFSFVVPDERFVAENWSL